VGAVDWQVPLPSRNPIFGVGATHMASCGRGFLFSVGSVVRLSLCFLAGLSPYAYIVWAAHNASPGSWGNTVNWSGFWHHFLRREYGTFQLYLGEDSKSDQLILALQYYFFDIVVDQGLYFSAIFACIGLVMHQHKCRSVSAIIGNLLGCVCLCSWAH
jgi:hypothetical protein